MKRIASILLLVLLLAGVSFAEDQNQELFDKANKEFKIAAEAGDNKPEVAKKAYLNAADLFIQIIHNGVKNSDIYYNLGNCYYQANDYPRAVLQYRRALVYAPNDEKIHSNLAAAQRMLNLQDPQQKESGIFDTIMAYNSKIPLVVKEYFNKISYVLFWGGLIGFLYFRRKVARKKFLLMAIAWWLSLVAVSGMSYLATTSADGVILDSEVIARKGDGANYEEAFLKPLDAGTEFTLVESRGDWLKIKLNSGNECWVRADAAGLVKDEP